MKPSLGLPSATRAGFRLVGVRLFRFWPADSRSVLRGSGLRGSVLRGSRLASLRLRNSWLLDLRLRGSRLVSSLLLGLRLVGIGCIAPPASTLQVQRGDTTLLQAEMRIARTAAERQQGLIGMQLEEGEALVIEFPIEDEVCILNRNVNFPIDAIFVSDAQSVVTVETFAANEPEAKCHYARWVIELPVGQANQIRPNDQVYFSF